METQLNPETVEKVWKDKYLATVGIRIPISRSFSRYNQIFTEWVFLWPVIFT
jgi:hypothetical protein